MIEKGEVLIQYKENGSTESDFVVKCGEYETQIAMLGLCKEIFLLTKNGRSLDGKFVITKSNGNIISLYTTYNFQEPIEDIRRIIFNYPQAAANLLFSPEEIALVDNMWFNIDIDSYLDYYYVYNTTEIVKIIKNLAKNLDKDYPNNPDTWVSEFIKDLESKGKVICSTGKCIHHTISTSLYDYRNTKHTLIYLVEGAHPIFFRSRSLTRNELSDQEDYETVFQYKEMRKFKNISEMLEYRKILNHKFYEDVLGLTVDTNISITTGTFDGNFCIDASLLSNKFIPSQYLYLVQALNSNGCKRSRYRLTLMDILDSSGRVVCTNKKEDIDKSIINILFDNTIYLIPSEVDKEETKNESIR